MPLTPQAYRKTEFIHRIGLAAARPAPGDVLVGTLYFSTDTQALERSNGTSWVSYYSTALTDGSVDRVIETGTTKTIRDRHSLIVVGYIEVQGTGTLAIAGDGVLAIT